MAPRESSASAPNVIERKGRKSSKFDYLPWAVQAKIKRHKVERMMIKRNYYSEKNKQPSGTGANAGAQDEGWGFRTERPVTESRPPDDPLTFDDSTLALGADRKPVRVPEVNVERPRPRKAKLERTRPTSPLPSLSQPTLQMPSGIPPKSQFNKTKITREEEETPGPRFRDLKREAYSRKSLHSHNSSPMHRSRGPSGFNARQPKRGQPNMKLRMEVMLEQIKRDAA